MLLNKGLSLTDHYWIIKKGLQDNWSSVNCFENEFKDGGPFDGKIVRNSECEGRVGPNATLKGNLAKKWVCKGGKQSLIKANHTKSCLQSINEVFISQVHKAQQKFHFVTYDFVEYHSGLGCICENFVTNDLDFIPAVDVIRGCKKKFRTLHEVHCEFIRVCELYGLDEKHVQQFLDYQTMIDFITTNTDRHLNNFGVLRDSNTLKFVGLAPIFDSGNSMGYTLHNDIPVGRNVLRIRQQIGGFDEVECKLLKHIKYKELVNIDKLPGIEDLDSLLSKDDTLDVFKKDRIERLYEAKVRFFKRFQDGEKIWLL